MIKKQTIAFLILTACLLYIISPWFFARKLFFNEILSLSGFLALAYKRFRIGNDAISISMIFLILLGLVHAFTSLFRMDTFYYYLRNSVILYSMMAFFLGFYILPYVGKFVSRIRNFLRLYIGLFILIPLPRYLFERFGMATLFPALFRKFKASYVPALLIILNIIYGISYDSVTIFILAAFYLLIFISPGYRFFMQSMFVVFLIGTIVFIYLEPNLALIANRYSPYHEVGIKDVMRSHPLLGLDGNTTWRLVLWREIIYDNFPGNIPGIGFGTPALEYYPVEEQSKLATLPYVLGAHNSFIYLFGRLGILSIILIAIIYLKVFKEYFYHLQYYRSNNKVLIFFSFFAITVIAFFNPVLESPVYAAGFWFFLGLVARCIQDRKNSPATA